MSRWDGWNKYRGLPLPLVRYLAAISLVGPLCAIGWLIVASADGRETSLVPVVLVTALVAMAERFQVHLTHKTYVSTATAVYVAMLLTLPLPACGALALLGAAAAQAHRFWVRPSLGIAEPLFNTGQTALYVTGAAALLEVAAPWRGTVDGIPLAQLVIASAALHAGNSLLVAGASARHLGRPTVRVWRRNLMLDLGPHAALTLIGLCAAALLTASPLLVPTLLLPAVLVHRAVQQSTELRANVRDALASLVEVVEMRDPYTAGHSRRVADLARSIALEMGLTAEEADAIEVAGKVHDLGKVAIDPAVLLKPGKLTDAEWAEMKRHPVHGAEVLARFAAYRSGIPLVRSHHESWDGSGYPDHLRGTDIPLGARILAVADTFDALTSDRPYRTGMELPRARAILQDGSGLQWDPAVVEAMLRVLEARAGQLTTQAESAVGMVAEARAA
jgi:HD-GYP domain-containing protein (c-di-GMP phosphodiesterase class II)